MRFHAGSPLARPDQLGQPVRDDGLGSWVSGFLGSWGLQCTSHWQLRAPVASSVASDMFERQCVGECRDLLRVWCRQYVDRFKSHETQTTDKELRISRKKKHRTRLQVTTVSPCPIAVAQGLRDQKWGPGKNRCGMWIQLLA